MRGFSLQIGTSGRREKFERRDQAGEAALRYVEERYREPLHGGLAAVCGLSDAFSPPFSKEHADDADGICE
ncbi:MAG: hypothetical protein ACLS5R_08095 [Blautia sp.]